MKINAYLSSSNHGIRMNAMYTVYKTRSKSNDARHGHSHYSHDADRTVCGKEVPEDGTWYIESNVFEGNATCPKCLKMIDVHSIFVDAWQRKHEHLLQHCLSCIQDSKLIKMGDGYRIALPYRFLQFADFKDGGVQAVEEDQKK